MLYLVRGSESGGFIHISEKDVFEDSDAMDAKLVLAFKQHWTLESLLANKLTIRAINKQNELTLDVVLFPPSAAQ